MLFRVLGPLEVEVDGVRRHAARAGSSCAADRVAAAAEPGRARARPRAIDLGGGFARPGRQGAAPSRRAGAPGAGGAERGRRHPPARLPVGGGRIRDRCGPVRGAVPGRPGRRRPAYRRGLAGGGAGAVAWARLRGVRRWLRSPGRYPPRGAAARGAGRPGCAADRLRLCSPGGGARERPRGGAPAAGTAGRGAHAGPARGRTHGRGARARSSATASTWPTSWGSTRAPGYASSSPRSCATTSIHRSEARTGRWFARARTCRHCRGGPRRCSGATKSCGCSRRLWRPDGW